MPKRARLQAVQTQQDPEVAAVYADARSLVPWPENPRKNDAAVPHIAESIKKFGFGAPIVARLANREIIAGETRWKAALSIGWRRVPVRFLDLSEELAHQLAVADNRLGELADWDWAKIHRVMERWDSDAIKRLGFSEKELKAVKQAVESAESPKTTDSAPPPSITPVTNVGDLWRLGNHRLLCGDATEAAHVKKAVGLLKPTLMVTAPPYDASQNWEAAYKLFTGDVAYVWHAGTAGSATETSLRSAGLLPRQQIVWIKQNFVVGRGAYQWQHEPCWYLVRKGGDARWCGDRAQSTVWQLQNTNPMGGSTEDMKTGHPHQKPVDCFERPMRNHGKPGDVVYDPFCGSGTAIVAAERSQRTAVVLEIDPAHCDVIVNRWQQLTGKRAKRTAV